MSATFSPAFPSPPLRVRPLASGDDAAHHLALVTSGATTSLTLAPGTYHYASTFDVPASSSVSVHLEAGAIVVANVPGAPVFRADSITGRANPPGGATTTTADTVVGATSVTVSALHGLVAGNAIVLVSSTLSQFETHTIRSVSGSTVTFHEPIERIILSGATVSLLGGLPSLRLTGEPGSAITGSAEIALQFMGAQHCYVAGLTVAGAWSSWAMFFDWGTRDSTIEDVAFVADAVTPGSVAIGFEMTVNAYARRIRVDQTVGQFAGSAFAIQSGVNTWLEDSDAPGSIIGLRVACSGSAGSFDAGGARHAGATRCRFPDATSEAIQVYDGGSDITIDTCSAPRCAENAIHVYAPNTGVFPNVTVRGGDYTAAGNAGVLLEGGVHILDGLDVSGTPNGADSGVRLDGATIATITNVRADNTGGGSGAFVFVSTSSAKLSGCSALAARVYAINHVSSGLVQVAQFTPGTSLVNVGASSPLALAQAGLASVPTTGATTNLYWSAIAAARVEVTGALVLDAVLSMIELIPGAVYSVVNSTTGAHGVTFAGVAITQGKTMRIAINASGTGQAETAAL